MDKNFDEYTKKYTGELKIKIEELQKINRDFVQLEDVDKENSDQEWGINDEEDVATSEESGSKKKKKNIREGLRDLFLKTQEIKNEFFIEDRKAELDINKNEYFIYEDAFDKDITENYEKHKLKLLPDIIKLYNINIPENDDFVGAINKIEDITSIKDKEIQTDTKGDIKNEILLPYNIFRLYRNEYIKKKDTRFLSKKDYRIYNNFNTYINTEITNDEKFNNYNNFKNDENNDNIKNLLDKIDKIDTNTTNTTNNIESAITSDDKLSSLISVLREKKNEIFDESNNTSEQESKDNKKISKKKIIEEIFFNRFKLVKITEIKNLDPIISVKKDELEDKEDRTEKETINNKRKMQLISNINEKIKKSIGDPDVKFRYFYFQYRYIVETKNCWMFSDKDLETDNAEKPKEADNPDKTKNTKSKIDIYKEEMNKRKKIELGKDWDSFTENLWNNIFNEIKKINDPQKFLDIFMNMLDNIFEKKGDIEERTNLRKILKNTKTRINLFEKMRFLMQKNFCENIEKQNFGESFNKNFKVFKNARNSKNFNDFLRHTYNLSKTSQSDNESTNLFLDKIKNQNEIEKCRNELDLLRKQQLFKLHEGEDTTDIKRKIEKKEEELNKLIDKQVKIIETNQTENENLRKLCKPDTSDDKSDTSDDKYNKMNFEEDDEEITALIEEKEEIRKKKEKEKLQEAIEENNRKMKQEEDTKVAAQKQEEEELKAAAAAEKAAQSDNEIIKKFESAAEKGLKLLGNDDDPHNKLTAILLQGLYDIKPSTIGGQSNNSTERFILWGNNGFEFEKWKEKTLPNVKSNNNKNKIKNYLNGVTKPNFLNSWKSYFNKESIENDIINPDNSEIINQKYKTRAVTKDKLFSETTYQSKTHYFIGNYDLENIKNCVLPTEFENIKQTYSSFNELLTKLRSGDLLSTKTEAENNKFKGNETKYINELEQLADIFSINFIFILEMLLLSLYPETDNSVMEDVFERGEWDDSFFTNKNEKDIGKFHIHHMQDISITAPYKERAKLPRYPFYLNKNRLNFYIKALDEIDKKSGARKDPDIEFIAKFLLCSTRIHEDVNILPAGDNQKNLYTLFAYLMKVIKHSYEYINHEGIIKHIENLKKNDELPDFIKKALKDINDDDIENFKTKKIGNMTMKKLIEFDYDKCSLDSKSIFSCINNKINVIDIRSILKESKEEDLSIIKDNLTTFVKFKLDVKKIRDLSDGFDEGVYDENKDSQKGIEIYTRIRYDKKRITPNISIGKPNETSIYIRDNIFKSEVRDLDYSKQISTPSRFYTYGPGTFIFDEEKEKIQELAKNITNIRDNNTHTVLTYGPSGAGKTYFIFGDENENEAEVKKSLIYKIINELKIQMSDNNIENIEITTTTYQTDINNFDEKNEDNFKEFKINEPKIIKDSEFNPIEVVKEINNAKKKRSTHFTTNNPESSRDHFIVTIEISDGKNIIIGDFAGREEPLKFDKFLEEFNKNPNIVRLNNEPFEIKKEDESYKYYASYLDFKKMKDKFEYLKEKNFMSDADKKPDILNMINTMINKSEGGGLYKEFEIKNTDITKENITSTQEIKDLLKEFTWSNIENDSYSDFQKKYNDGLKNKTSPNTQINLTKINMLSNKAEEIDQAEKVREFNEILKSEYNKTNLDKLKEAKDNIENILKNTSNAIAKTPEEEDITIFNYFIVVDLWLNRLLEGYNIERSLAACTSQIHENNKGNLLQKIHTTKDNFYLLEGTEENKDDSNFNNFNASLGLRNNTEDSDGAQKDNNKLFLVLALNMNASTEEDRNTSVLKPYINLSDIRKYHLIMKLIEDSESETSAPAAIKIIMDVIGASPSDITLETIVKNLFIDDTSEKSTFINYLKTGDQARSDMIKKIERHNETTFIGMLNTVYSIYDPQFKYSEKNEVNVNEVLKLNAVNTDGRLGQPTQVRIGFGEVNNVAVGSTITKIKEAYQNLFGIEEANFNKTVLNKLEISNWEKDGEIYVRGGEKNKLNKDIEKLKRKYFKLKSKQK